MARMARPVTEDLNDISPCLIAKVASLFQYSLPESAILYDIRIRHKKLNSGQENARQRDNDDEP
jgi:hypothetical protein